MTWVAIGLSAGTIIALATLFSYILGWANKAFHIEIDPRVQASVEALPGANCGGCGFVGCGEYAEAVVSGQTAINLCTVGGESCTAALADILGVEAQPSYPYRPIVHCGAHFGDRLLKSDYRGERRCSTVNLVTGVQGCVYGRLGFGDCERACDYDAIHVIDGLATVDYDKCVGCGACARVCPRNFITINPFKAENMLAVACSNLDAGKDVKRVCKVGCLGCKACERTSKLFKVENNLSTIDYENYTLENLEDALKASKRCPRNRLVFVGKPSDDDLAKLVGEELPDVIKPDFKTTVDDTEWRG